MNRELYGARETNPIGEGYHEQRWREGTPRLVEWTEPGLRITRLRLVSDRDFPYWDVSYCHGMVGDEHVTVQLPFSQLHKRKSISWQIVEWAEKDGVNARRLGAFSAISTLI